MAVKEAVTKAKRRIGVENPTAADADGNVGTVRGALRAFGEGEHDAFIDALQEDVKWEAPGGEFPGGGDLEGREDVKEKFVGDAGRTFTSFGFVPDNFVDTDDDAVIVIGRFTGEGAEGAAVDTPGVQIWQFGSSTEAELVRIYTDGAAFPENLTEEKLRKREEEEKKKEEEEKQKKAEAEKKEEESGDDSDDDEPKAKADSDSDDDSGSEKKDDDEG